MEKGFNLADQLEIDAVQEGKPEEKKRQESKTGKLIKMAMAEAELFHDHDQKPYVTIKKDGHRETYRLRSRSFRSWLSGRYWSEYGNGVGAQILQDAISTLEGHAVHAGSCHAVHVRLAETNGAIYLDLGHESHDVVEIIASGWRIVSNQCAVKFIRPPGSAPLPYPRAGGSLDKLKRYINLSSPHDWVLLVGYSLMCFNPSGPYPILVLTGEQGSAKSSGQRVIKSLTDPSTAPLRSLPKEIRDLAISSLNCFVLAFDNLSEIPGTISDALCRLATGGGFATRTLFENDEETIIDTKRPVMLNGISNFIRRHDLADRSLLINLDAIPETERATESDFWGDFEDDAPEILGALLDATSCALRNYKQIKLDRVPRMADFAIWVTAAEEALGWDYGTFLAAYAQNRRDVAAQTLDADLVGTAISSYMEGRDDWEGTASELLKILTDLVDEKIEKTREWPRTPNSLSGKLRRSATSLRADGIDVVFGKKGHIRQRLITLEKRGEEIVRTVRSDEKYAENLDMNEENMQTMSDAKIVRRSSAPYKDRPQADDVADDAQKRPSAGTMSDSSIKTKHSAHADDTDDANDEIPLYSKNGEAVIDLANGRGRKEVRGDLHQ